MDKMELDTLRILERLDSIQASIYDLDKRIEVASAVTDTKLAILPATYVSKGAAPPPRTRDEHERLPQADVDGR